MCCKSSLCLCYGNGNKLYLIQFIPSDPLCIYWAVAYKQWTWQHNSCIPGVRCTERWSGSRLVFANFNWLMHDRSPRKQLRVNREQGSRENYELIILKSGYDIVFPQLNVMWRTQHWQSLILMIPTCHHYDWHYRTRWDTERLYLGVLKVTVLFWALFLSFIHSHKYHTYKSY